MGLKCTHLKSVDVLTGNARFKDSYKLMCFTRFLSLFNCQKSVIPFTGNTHGMANNFQLVLHIKTTCIGFSCDTQK